MFLISEPSEEADLRSPAIWRWLLSWKAWNEVKHILLDRYGPTTARKTPTLLLPHYSPGSPLHAWRELDLDGQNEARDHHEIVLRLVAS